MRLGSLALLVALAAVSAPTSAAAQDRSPSVAQSDERPSIDSAPLVVFEVRADTALLAADLRVTESEPSDRPDAPEFPLTLAFAAAAARKKAGGRKAAAKTAKTPAAAPTVPPTPSTAPPVPAATSNKQFEKEREEDRKATTGSDTTVPGGRYIGADGVARDAEGRVLDEKKKKGD